MLRGSNYLLPDLFCKPLREAFLEAIAATAPNMDEHQVRIGTHVEFTRVAVQQERDLGVLVLAVQVTLRCLGPGQ
ncbi:hypothetical protein SSPNP10_14840 [Streptomyces sp. NP10]|nr:hypothetical protein SSPNP10_14840 [Streptomyces sp. NP10]